LQPLTANIALILPTPSGVVIRNAPEWLKTNSVAVFGRSFLG